LETTHFLTQMGYKLARYQWESCSFGDLKIGLWRRKIRQSPNPRRFVLVPGFGDTTASWSWVLLTMRSVLDRDFDEVVLLDFPGVAGKLAGEKYFHSMDLLVEAVRSVLDGLEPHTIVGHSLGGWLAAGYACACGAGDRPYP